jgi:hypothetical protein
MISMAMTLNSIKRWPQNILRELDLWTGIKVPNLV